MEYLYNVQLLLNCGFGKTGNDNKSKLSKLKAQWLIDLFNSC